MNAKDAWLATLGQLQIQLNRATYDTWLRHAELLGYEDGRFVVTVPHAYAKDWIERHLLDSMTRTLQTIFRRECELQIIVWDPVEDNLDSPLVTPEEQVREAVSKLSAQLNPHYTFDTLVVGQANHYAALLARAIVESPLGKYSPVLICGEMGVGKTHLLQAIAHKLIERGDQAIYVSAETFTTELVSAIRGQDTQAIREKYRTADAVLIDDAQFIEGKQSTQNEIVAVWDALRNRQRTMIFASDRLPADMPRLSRDVQGRLQAGPIAVIDTPDESMRRAILDAHAQRRGIYLPPEVRDEIAGKPDSTPRDLLGAVEQLHTYSQLTRQPITLYTANEALHLRRSNASRRANKATLEAVIEAVAAYYRLGTDELAGRQRTKLVAQARQLCMYLARELTDASLIQIGTALGGRDHSTVMHGCTKIAERLAADPLLADDVAQLRGQLSSTKSAERTAQEILLASHKPTPRRVRLPQ